MGYFKSWYNKNIADIDPQKESRQIWELAEEIKEDFNGKNKNAIYIYCAELELTKIKLENELSNNINTLMEKGIKTEKQIKEINIYFNDYVKKIINETIEKHDKLKKLKAQIENDINSIQGESITEVAKIQTYNSILMKIIKLLND